jgi:predicted ATP-binding protein involved in virulence
MGPLTLKPGEGVWVDRLKIENFRAIANLELEFKYRLTVLIGENGAGKTTVLDTLAFMLRTNGAGQSLGNTDRGRVLGVKANTKAICSWKGSTWSSSPQGYHTLRGMPLPGNSVRLYFRTDRWNQERYSQLVSWFDERDVAELRQRRELADPAYRDPLLTAVGDAVAKMIPDTTNPRIGPDRTWIVDQKIGDRVEKLPISELAGGLRTMLVLVADLAKAIAEASAGQPEPVPAVVLIDEIDLHIHPRWQLEIVRNLLDAFPTVQFIVTTHSEEIISSVPSECVIKLESDEGQVVASPIPRVQGATFDRVLEDAMGLPSKRPPEVQQQLDAYWKLVDAGEGETPEAFVIRSKLDDLFRGQEPELVRADLVIRRRRMRAGTGT